MVSSSKLGLSRAAAKWKWLACLSCALNAAFVVLTALFYHASLSAHPTKAGPQRTGIQQSVSNSQPSLINQYQSLSPIVSVNQNMESAVLDTRPIKEGHCQQPPPGDIHWLSSLKTWQDERRRQYLGRLPKLQPNYCGPVSVAELDTSSLVFATFTNAAPVYVEQLLNWAFHLRELQLPHVVVCLDNESEDIAVSNGIPFVTVQNKTTSEDVRNDHASFRAMVSRKVDLARSLLEDHNFQEIIWTDTDVVWLRSPLAFFNSHPTADMAIQTDCLSHFVETGYTKPFQHGFARCGHMPGNGFNNAFNTGMILLRNRPATHTFLKNWLDYLLDANRMYVDLGGGNKAIVGDQLAFNTLMTRGSLPWKSVGETEDWRIVWGHDQTVKFMPLPTLMFSGGHSYFIQHQASQYNTTPFYAHACLVPGHVPGKVARFKEHNLWAIEDDSYYTEGSFLFYENTVRDFISKLEHSTSEAVPDLYKHMLAVSYQMSTILEASAIAHALNRTVVFPRFWCWCDFDWYAVVLDGCSMGGRPGEHGADLFSKPFECPIDVILNPHNLYHKGFKYRQERFLEHRRTPTALVHDREPVLVMDAHDSVGMMNRQRMVNNTFTGAYIPMGVTNEGLQKYLAPWKNVRTLELRYFLPGTFSGFTDIQQAAAVDEAVFPLFADKSWCCSGEQPMPVHHLQWQYLLPERVSSRLQRPGSLVAPLDYRVPKYIRPDFCDGIRNDPVNAKFLEFPNHPCTYLALPYNFPSTVSDVFALAV